MQISVHWEKKKNTSKNSFFSLKISTQAEELIIPTLLTLLLLVCIRKKTQHLLQCKIGRKLKLCCRFRVVPITSKCKIGF